MLVTETDNDPLSSSETKSRAKNEHGSFEVLVSIIIWYEILSKVNLISKELQSKDMLIHIANKSIYVFCVISFLILQRLSGDVCILLFWRN